MKKVLTFLLVFISSIQFSKAQLFVDTAYTPQQMIQDFFDTNGVTISNITYNGVNAAVGFFDAGSTNLGINAGIMFTSGSAFNAVGPNVSSGITTDNQSAGDPDLDDLSLFPTHDASVVEFDIVPVDDTLFFKYVFGSDEYTEWVNTSFNDVFGFFLNGPGYTGENIALVPGTNLPASINNVNCLNGSPYYVCNDPNNFQCPDTFNCPTDYLVTTIEYDGFTKPLSIFAIVTPNESYHVKIGVADASDGVLDSGVFLSIESLDGGDSLAAHSDHSKEENGNQVIFHDLSKYASHWYWDFGDGTFSNERNPVHTYNNLADSVYVVKQKVWNFCCADSSVFGVGNILMVQNVLDNPVSVSPNPVMNVMNINLKNGSAGEMYLYDLSGKLLLSKNILGNTQLDMSSFSPGVYVLSFNDGKEIFYQKILKQ